MWCVVSCLTFIKKIKMHAFIDVYRENLEGKKTVLLMILKNECLASKWRDTEGIYSDSCITDFVTT